MKKIIISILSLFFGITACYCLPQSKMSGRAAKLLYGNVQKVETSSDESLTFNADGNLVETKSERSIIKREYQSPTEYTENGLKFRITYTDNQRIETLIEEKLVQTYTFDPQGRLISLHEPSYGESSTTEYLYDGNQILPYKVIHTGLYEEGEYVTTTTYQYNKIDENGNWLSANIKVHQVENGASFPEQEFTTNRTITYFTSEVATVNNSDSTSISSSSSTSFTSSIGGFFENFLNIMIRIIFYLILALPLVHMIYVFIKSNGKKESYTIEKFSQQRRSEGLESESNEEENTRAEEYLQKAIADWKPGKQEPDMVKPRKNKHLKTAQEYIDKTIALKPTDAEIVERLNELSNAVNVNNKRYFDGSKKLVIISAIVGLFFIFFMKENAEIGWYILTGCGIYILASMCPAFLVNKKAERQAGNVHDGIFAGVAAMVAGAKTIRTITTYSDGTVTKHDDHSQHWIVLALGFIVAFIMALLIIFWALINYLRNYILFF